MFTIMRDHDRIVFRNYLHTAPIWIRKLYFFDVPPCHLTGVLDV